MDVLQPILVYITLGLALGYLLYKFIIPRRYLSPGKKTDSACGQDNCGCH